MFIPLLLIGLAIVVLYFLFWPVPVRPVKWKPPKAPELADQYAANQALAAAQRLDIGGRGPEDVIFDKQGYLYSGLEDGRIVRMQADGRGLETVAQTGGRPLGLAVDSAGNIIVADAYKGLLTVDRQGKVTVLVDEFEGRKLVFANHLDIAADGTIYFTESSDHFGLHDTSSEVLENGPNGRLLAYDPRNGETRLVLDRLHFANGVAISPDQSYLLLAETDRYRLRRLWLAGPRAGEMETFADNLPGFPDNMHGNGRDTYWVGFVTPRIPIADALAGSPFVRKMVYRLPSFLKPTTGKHGLVLGFNEAGEVVHNFQDPSGGFAETSGAVEYDGALYVGTLNGKVIGRLPLPTAA